MKSFFEGLDKKNPGEMGSRGGNFDFFAEVKGETFLKSRCTSPTDPFETMWDQVRCKRRHHLESPVCQANFRQLVCRSILDLSAFGDACVLMFL